MLKKFAFFLTLLAFSSLCFAQDTAEVIFEGKNKGEVALMQIDGQNFVDAKALSKYLRLQTNWFWNSGQLNIRGVDGFFATVRVGEDFATIKGEQRPLSGTATSKNKKIFIPVNFFTEGPCLTAGNFQTAFDGSKFIIEKVGALASVKNVASESATLATPSVLSEKASIAPATEVLGDDFFNDVSVPASSKKTVVNRLQTSTDLRAIRAKDMNKDRSVRIFIDPGHGGKDPGAVYRGSSKEKDINLTVARELVRLLKKEKRVEVEISRNNDTFIALGDRAKMANDFKADIFVSIHANAAKRKTASGFEVYFRSDKASDKEAAQTAALENEALNYENEGTGKTTYADLLLKSLATNEKINESSKLAAQIRNATAKSTGKTGIQVYQKSSIKQANFYVLQGVKAPSILVEMGYLTNSSDKKRLNSKRTNISLAESIKDGILSYAKLEGWKF